MNLRLAGWIFASLLVLNASAFASDTGGGRTIAERLGYPANSRLLVIHADDFGMAHAVNRAISEALEKRWVTSASILVPCPWFPEVALWAKSHPDADLGVHLALNSEWTTFRWRPVSAQPKGSSLLDRDGYLPLETQEVDEHAKPMDAEVEASAQIDKAMAAGIHLSHLDPHMGSIASTPDLLKVYVGLGQKYKLPVLLEPRPGARAPSASQVGINGIFLPFAMNRESIPVDQILQIMPGVPQSQWLDAYKKILTPLAPGVYELIVHLGYNDPEMQGATADHPDWGAQWRQNDLDVVRNPAFQQFLKDQGFVLISWKDLRKATPL